MGGLITASVLGEVLDWLQIAARDVVTWIEDLVGAVSITGWVLLALALTAVTWVVAGMRASTRLGPIEVAPLEHDGDHQAAVLALTAEFRERLAKSGLTPPPAVPQGAPQADLIKAVEASPIPQGAFIAKLMELLPAPPRPAQYKILGTLSGKEKDKTNGAEEEDEANVCGVSFWLQPVNGDASLLDTVPKCETHSIALSKAAARVYLYIAKSAPDVFPLWVRWRTPDALDKYVEGCDVLRDGGALDKAIEALEKASKGSPFNALARLQLANLDERCAADASPGDAALYQARALRRYLEVARLWPAVVEARYRASVIAAGLATRCDALTGPDLATVQAWLPLPQGTEDFPDRLRRLASRESSATLQLLRPWYVLLRGQRLRNQFEPKAAERRALKHTMRISKHCVRVRSVNDAGAVRKGSKFWYRGFSVHVVHVFLGKGNLTWQARYNAACFDALLLEGGRVGDRRRVKVEERALRNLDEALREAAGELSSTWAASDPDLAYFQ
jgi:hypothetical protein